MTSDNLAHRSHFGDQAELEKVRRYQTLTWRYIEGELSKVGDFSILDVGASEGFFGRLIANEKRFHYLGIDPFPVPGAYRVEQGTTQTVIENGLVGSYDLVIYCHVLEHIPDTHAELSRAYQLCVPGGLLFLAVPDAGSTWAWEQKSHIALFNRIILDKAVASCGFEICEGFTITFREHKTELWLLSKKPMPVISSQG